MNRIADRDYEFYDFNDESDHEPCSSSDDDLDIILHGTPEQKRKLQNKVRQRSKSSSEDEFEKEMNDDLNKHIKDLESERSNRQLVETQDNSKTLNLPKVREPDRFYDDIYFDSDEEEMVLQGNERVKRRKPVVSNDDLLYDPKQDDEDQQWVNAQRQSYQPPVPSGSKQQPLPHSDAVLNCPACMTLLCLDCQRHDIYQNQYRAMFVKNCHVDTAELLKQPLQKKKYSKKQKKSETENDDGDNFHPVKCTECTTVVGMCDTDEVYHFFNVLASHT